jgi:hypothetical protein
VGRKRKDPLDEDGRNGDALRRGIRIDALLASSQSTRKIAQTIVAEYDVAERTAYLDIAAAYERLRVADDVERAHRKNRIRLRWERQFQRCLSKGEMSAANYALDRLTKLDGLYEPDRVEVKNELSVMLGALVLTPYQRQQRISELRAKLPAAVVTRADDPDLS